MFLWKPQKGSSRTEEMQRKFETLHRQIKVIETLAEKIMWEMRDPENAVYVRQRIM